MEAWLDFDLILISMELEEVNVTNSKSFFGEGIQNRYENTSLSGEIASSMRPHDAWNDPVRATNQAGSCNALEK